MRLSHQRAGALLFFGGCSAAIAAAPCAAATHSNGAVSGRVTSVDGQPISAAIVTLTGNGTDRTGTTDRAGRFTIGPVPGGTYAVRLVARGYDASSGNTIDVRPADITQISLELVRSATSLVTIGRVGADSGPTVSTSSVPAQDLNAQAAAARGVANVADMLSAGTISTTVIHPAGGNPAAPVVVALRGPDPTETLIDVDGHAVNSGGTGSFDLSLLDPADLASVQLVYGISPSSLVGPNTINGAINVRTLEPTAASHGLLRFSAGSFASFAQTLEATGTQQRIGYAFSLHRTTTQGEVNDRTILTTGGTTPTVGSAIDGTTALAKVRYTFGRGEDFVTLTVRDQSQFRDVSAALSSIIGTPGGTPAPPASGDQNSARRTLDARPMLDATLAAPATFNSFAGSSLGAHNAGYGFDAGLPLGRPDADGFSHTSVLFRHLTSLSDQSVDGAAAGSSPYLYNDRDRVSDESLELDRTLTKSVLSLKVGMRDEQLDTQQIVGGSAAAPQDQSSIRRPFATGTTVPAPATVPAIVSEAVPLAGVGQVQRSAVLRYAYDPSAKLHYTLAGYYSNFSSFGTSFDPRAGFVWTPTAQSAVRFSLGSSFQSPQLPELYVPTLLPLPDAGGHINVGNPNLKADHATEYDLGYEHVFAAPNPTRVSIDLYRSNLRTPSQRYIPAATCSGASTIALAANCESFPINVGGAVYQGVELRFEHRLASSAAIRAGYSINSNFATNVSPQFQNGTIVVGEQIQGAPLHRAFVALENTATTGLTYHAGLSYEDAYNGLNRPAYATVDAGLSWHFGSSFDIGVFATNLTNVYADSFTVAGAGVPYAGVNGPIASDAYALQGRKLSLVVTRRY